MKVKTTLDSIWKKSEEYLKLVNQSYRKKKGDNARTLYLKVLSFSYDDKFSENFVKLVYDTLTEWNMNNYLGAKLNDYDVFCSSIIENKKLFDEIKDQTIENFENEKNISVLKLLFDNLKLTKTKSKWVTFSKTMHFFLPNLIVPIDGKYTMRFFFGYHLYKPDKEFGMFVKIESAFAAFSRNHDLTQYIDDDYNQVIPKILDNLIIGYVISMQKKRYF